MRYKDKIGVSGAGEMYWNEIPVLILTGSVTLDHKLTHSLSFIISKIGTVAVICKIDWRKRDNMQKWAAKSLTRCGCVKMNAFIPYVTD